MTLADDQRFLGRGGLSHRRPSTFGRFHFGVCYYPEHWDDRTRRDDAKRMADAGMNVVRMAEFAWSVIEPKPGSFTFAFFDDVIGELADHGIDTILCTPTATPPHWLLRRHPDMVQITASGQPLIHGSRQHASYFHNGFRAASREITRAMAEHWRNHTSVIGWQTDNEFHCHSGTDYSEAAVAAWHVWLGAKYETIDRLNATWGTAFWNQTYDAFDNVPLPKADAPTYANPAHHADFLRFLGDGVSDFQREQVTILRKTNPGWWITHNGVFEPLDYRGQLTGDLDVLGYDVYSMFHTPERRAARQAFNCDRVRGFSGNFIVPEHQAGAGGQTEYMLEQPMPGEMRQQVYRTIARGADSLLFFRWRSCRVGAEQYWLGLVDHDNVGRRRLDEATQIGSELREIGPKLLGSTVAIDCAMAECDADVAIGHNACTLGLPEPKSIASDVHDALLSAGLSPGCVHPSDDLSGVGLYIIPHWAIFDTAWVEQLTSWVHQGGRLVVGARTATRDLANNIVPDTLPGVLRDLAGVTISDYGPLHSEGRPVHLDNGIRGQHWFEAIEPDDGTDVLHRWDARALGNPPAITRRTVGAGWVSYVGTYLTPEVIGTLMPTWTADFPRLRLSDLPADIEFVRREHPDGSVIDFFFNNAVRGSIAIPVSGTALLGETDGAQMTLPPFGVGVVMSEMPTSRSASPRPDAV
ncbi:MAG: beta-galactosidase [Planctomycetota bacterium]